MNYIFLDTNVFYGSNQRVMDYFVPPFNYLSMLAGYGFCKLILPEVSKIEEQAHIKKKVAEFVKNNGLPLQRINEYCGIQNELNLREKFFELYEKFLNSTNAVLIPMNDLKVDAAEMVNLRYTHGAPFTAEKDNEFQDILIATSLVKFFNEHTQDQFVIVTKDKGFKKYLESKWSNDNVSYFKDLDDYIKPMLSVLQEKNKEVIQVASDYVSGMTEFIELAILSCLESNIITIEENGNLVESIDISSVDVINSKVEMAEIIDETVYAFVLCEVEYYAKAEVFNDDKSEYDYCRHEYVKKVYDPITINKKWSIRLMIELWCEFDDKGNIMGITEYNDIEITDGLDLVLNKDDIEYK